MTKLYSIILAGGAGVRLWPLSREMFPKQMLKLDGEYTLFQKTFLNLTDFIDDKNIITVTNVKYASQIKEQLKNLQEKFGRKIEYKMLSEPESKNTAAAVTLGCTFIKSLLNHNKDDVILVSPCDHIISNRENFSEILSKGIKLAKEGYIVSFGTETVLKDEFDDSFGYIKAGKNSKIRGIEPDALKAAKFVEKPDNDDKKDLKGKIYINSGNYMFTAETMLSEIKKYELALFDSITDEIPSLNIPSVALKNYENLENLSIDYAVMEHTKKLAVIPVPPLWKDIGSWCSMYEVLKKDKNNNVVIGKSIDIGSKNTFIYSPSKLTATIGLNNKTVVATEDSVYVADINDKSGIKKIYAKITGDNAKTKEIHQTVYRPWGYYTVLENGCGFLTKCIVVNPDSKLSVQLHHHRSEHWIILEGEAVVLKGDKKYNLKSGESIDISVEEVHSLQNDSKEQLKVLEIQQGDILDENDIERLEDIYGRV